MTRTTMRFSRDLTPGWALAMALGVVAAATPGGLSAQSTGCDAAAAAERWADVRHSVDPDVLSQFAQECAGAREARMAERRLRSLRRALDLRDDDEAPDPPDVAEARGGSDWSSGEAVSGLDDAFGEPYREPEDDVASLRDDDEASGDDGVIEEADEHFYEEFRDQHDAAWRAVRDSRDVSAVQDFLRVYPESPYREESRDLLAELREGYRRAQIALRRLLFYRGAIDGSWGPMSRRAYRGFLSSEGLAPVSEFPTRDDLAMLERRADEMAPARDSAGFGRGDDGFGRDGRGFRREDRREEAIQSALERTRSGRTVRVGGVLVAPRPVDYDRRGRPCREYGIRIGAGPWRLERRCRMRDGVWR